MITTSGTWTAKAGREDEFVRRWQEGADALVVDYPNLTFRLLRHEDDPRRFVSLTDGWRNREQIAEVQSLPSVQDAQTALWRVLDAGETSTLELVAEVS
jgi:quinol monooxygenase YgiN